MQLAKWILLLYLFCAFALSAMAQNQQNPNRKAIVAANNTNADDSVIVQTAKAVVFRNTIKWNATALLMNGINLGYERQLYKFVSADAALKFRPYSELPQRDFVIDRLYRRASQNAKDYMRQADLQQMSLTVMLRFYLNFLNDKKNQGYYLALFNRLEYNQYKGKLNYVSPHQEVTFTHLDITQTKAGLGLMMGYTTALFSKRLVLDFYILGVQMADTRYNFKFSNVFTASQELAIQEEIAYNFNAKFTADITSKDAAPLRVQTNARLQQWLTFGVSLGFKF